MLFFFFEDWKGFFVCLFGMFTYWCEVSVLIGQEFISYVTEYKCPYVPVAAMPLTKRASYFPSLGVLFLACYQQIRNLYKFTWMHTVCMTYYGKLLRKHHFLSVPKTYSHWKICLELRTLQLRAAIHFWSVSWKQILCALNVHAHTLSASKQTRFHLLKFRSLAMATETAETGFCCWVACAVKDCPLIVTKTAGNGCALEKL